MRDYRKVIKAIIFDLGRVIVPFDFDRGYARIAALTGIPAAEISGRIRVTGLVERFERGELARADFVSQLSQHLTLTSTDQEFCELWNCIFLPDTLIPESLLEGLRRSHRLLLLSNTNSIHFQMARKNYPLLRHFDSYVLSYEVGMMKPAPQIYREAIARAGCLPQECLFIDDLEINVAAARQEGMDAEQFVSLDKLEKDLRARSLVW